MREIVIGGNLYKETEIHCVKCGESGVWRHAEWEYEHGFSCLCANCNFEFSTYEDGGFVVKNQEDMLELRGKIKANDFRDNYDLCNTWEGNGCSKWVKKSEMKAHRDIHEKQRQWGLEEEARYKKEHGHPKPKLFMSSGSISATLNDQD